ncbi:type VII secretion protein EccE [Mycobacteroides abscessus]|uniref:type VII secretion protein EccE n=1 Tax=Mycobacteroides abscessus TaxID=36809 RepID=UPI0002D82C05|nr:type VII secretion protein EccE [Mycobacteroides abscessus]
MKARTVTLAAPPTTVVAAELSAVGLLLVLAVCGWLNIYSAAAVVVIVAAVSVVWLYDRNVAGWAARLAGRRFTPDPLDTIAAPHDVRRSHQLLGDMVIGVQRDANIVTAVLELGGAAYAPTLLAGPGASPTPNVVPVQVLLDQLVQPGPLVLASIDVVSAGSRVRRAQGYPSLYSLNLRDRSARGQGRSYVIVRLDIERSIEGLILRDSVEEATAAVAERVLCALRQAGCRAEPLDAERLTKVIHTLGGPILDGAAQATRTYIDTTDGYWATYVYSAEDITNTNLTDIWSWRCDSAVSTLSFALDADTGAARVSAFVRTDTPQAPTMAPTVYLNPVPGQQVRGALACVPGAARLDGLPTAVVSELETLIIPVGPAGILVGTIDLRDGTLPKPVMVPFTDPFQDTRILVAADISYVRQLLIRNAAVGERIAVYTDDLRRWAGLVDPLIEILDNPQAVPKSEPTILVKDHRQGSKVVTSAPTIMSLPTDTSYPEGLKPDIEFTALDAHHVQVSAGDRQWVVAIASFPDERPYLGLAA